MTHTVTNGDRPEYAMGGSKPKAAEKIRVLLSPRYAGGLSKQPSMSASQASVLYPVQIRDVSVWNGKIDFKVMRTQAQGVYIRAGYGNLGVDSSAKTNVVGALGAGMVWGLYWYVMAGQDLNKHIESFARAYADIGGKLPPVFDCEHTELSRTGTTDWLSKLVKIWVSTTGVDPIIYTRASWWDTYTARSAWPKNYLLWVAQYNSWVLNPIIPIDWSSLGYDCWTFWQWSADGNDQGPANGATGDDMDLNRYRGSIDEFNAAFGTSIVPIGEIPPPPPPPPPQTGEIVPIRSVTVSSTATPHLNIRSLPDAGSKDLGNLMMRSLVPVVKEDGDWLLISGWINKKFVK